MRLVESALIYAVVLSWLDATYFSETHFNVLYAMSSQLVAH
jgi:hypothetical protein